MLFSSQLIFTLTDFSTIYLEVKAGWIHPGKKCAIVTSILTAVSYLIQFAAWIMVMICSYQDKGRICAGRFLDGYDSDTQDKAELYIEPLKGKFLYILSIVSMVTPAFCCLSMVIASVIYGIKAKNEVVKLKSQAVNKPMKCIFKVFACFLPPKVVKEYMKVRNVFTDMDQDL